MKKVLSIALFQVIFCLSYGQSNEVIIPKGAESISIIGDSSTNDKIIETLVVNGFSPSSVTDYVIKTEQNRIKTWNFDINVTNIKNKFTFKIYWSSSTSVYVGAGVTSGPTRGICSYKGMTSSARKVGFNKLLEMVEGLGYEYTFN
tara:strand:- start:34 stop:471 length:438 start_codon:yes stop_codon:yes gene_type:complete